MALEIVSTGDVRFDRLSRGQNARFPRAMIAPTTSPIEKWVWWPADPDSSPFALVWTRISWLSSLVNEGEAATIC
jgi:hypothetical protein